MKEFSKGKENKITQVLFQKRFNTQASKNLKNKKKKKKLDILKVFKGSLLGKADIPFILSHFAKLLTLYCYLDKNEEFFEIIKDYTEIIQSSSFLTLGKFIFTNSKLGVEVLRNFKFEVISIFVIFYSLLE